MKLFFNQLLSLYPFSITGSILLIISLYLLGIAGGTGNLYALIFSFSGILSIMVFAGIGWIIKIKNQDELIILEQTKPIFARYPDQYISILIHYNPLPIFFRFHYRIQGKFKVGRKSYFSVYFENAIRITNQRQDHLKIPVFFPFCGVGTFRGTPMIKDIFGFTRIILKKPENFQISVLVPLFQEKAQIHIIPSTTQESLRNIQTSDEEKYFMREYIPGDRLKDINWKSSIKLSELITKISPSSPEESHLIHVEIRPYHDSNQDGPEAILELNYLKSWVLSFLKTLKKEHPNYHFHIFSGKEIFLLETEKDLDSFTKYLSELEYISKPITHEPPPSTEKFVFSTGFDKQIHSYIRNSQSKIYLFRVTKGKKRKVYLYSHFDFSLLPGLWIFRKENPDKTSPKPKKGKLIEEAIKLYYI